MEKYVIFKIILIIGEGEKKKNIRNVIEEETRDYFINNSFH